MEQRPLKEVVGGNIRRLRNARGDSLIDMANAIGGSASNLCDIENGKKDPKLSTLGKIARFLEVPPEMLLETWESVKRLDSCLAGVCYRYLVQPEICEHPDLGKYPSYGLRVEMRVEQGRWALLGFQHDISTRREDVAHMAGTFTDGQLSPLHLRCVIEDLLP